MLYPSTFAGSNQATAGGWAVDDVEATVADLRSSGVVFEEYDFDELKTEDGIANTVEENSRQPVSRTAKATSWVFTKTSSAARIARAVRTPPARAGGDSRKR